jgi:hypothetical protein
MGVNIVWGSGGHSSFLYLDENIIHDHQCKRSRRTVDQVDIPDERLLLLLAQA